MMLLALTAVLLTPVQDDPAVLYREGLYEEIDQGNLEKAMDVYGRLLKGNAEPGLKARAFYRRGACLEKTGKKTEAEQVYRDVQERFPEQAEVVKLARGRLAALSGNGRAATFSPEAEVQQLILDLGSTEKPTRDKAVHRLTLIGAASVPDLKRALSHKDSLLAAGAARVLLVLEPGEGLYEALIRSHDRDDLRSLARLFQARPEDQERFFKDSEKLAPGPLGYAVSTQAPFTRDPRLRRVVEDRLIKDGQNTNEAMWPYIWGQIAAPEDLPGVLRRLLKEEGKDHPRLLHLLSNLSNSRIRSEKVNPESSGVLREGLKDLDPPDSEWVTVLLPYVTPDDFIRGLFPVWLRSDAPKSRVEAAKAFNLIRGNPAVDYAFEVLASDDYPDDAKSALFEHSGQAESLAQGKQKEQLLKYYLGVLRKTDPKLTEDRVIAGLSGGPRAYVYRNLPPEAPEWDLLFDQEMSMSLGPQFTPKALADRLKTSERLRARYVEGTQRAMKSDSVQVRTRAVWQHHQYASPAEERALAKVLPDFPEEGLMGQVAHHLAVGFKPLTSEEWKTEVKAIEPLFASPKASLRRSMAYEFSKYPVAALEGAMKVAMSDPDVGVRSNAIEYWSLRRVPEGSALLIEALRDPNDSNKVLAVQALARAPSLDAVPPLLEHLRSSNDELRKVSQAALKAIQQYYDEQDQWRKWYEETKKKAPKEK